MSGAAHAGDQLFHEPAEPALRVRRAFAVADVQHLAGIGADREDRVIPKLAGVPVARALLTVGVDFADEAVDVDHQWPVPRSAAGGPRAGERDIEHAVELADVPERERAQERPECRRRHHPVPQDQAG